MIDLNHRFFNIFKFSVFYYLLATLVIYKTVDFSVLNHRRLTVLMSQSYFPIQYSINKRFSKSDFIASIRYYKILLRQYPKLFRANELIGYCFYYLNDINKAEKYYLRANRLNSQSIWSSYNLGVINFKKGQYKAAINYLKTITGMSREDLLSIYKKDSVNDIDTKKYKDLLLLKSYEIYQNSIEMLMLSYNEIGDKEKEEECKKIYQGFSIKPNTDYKDLVLDPLVYFVVVGREKE